MAIDHDDVTGENGFLPAREHGNEQGTTGKTGGGSKISKTDKTEKTNQLDQENDYIEFWKQPEYTPLVNREHLLRLAGRDPWQYQVADKLRNFLFRMERRKVVNFKVSGIVLHSASVLCRAKADSMLDQGNRIHENLLCEDDDADDDGYTMAGDACELLDDCMDVLEDERFHDENGEVKDKRTFERVLEMIARADTPEARAISKRAMEKFLVPKRIVARPVTMGDLATALNDALKGKFRRRPSRDRVSKVVLPEAIKESRSESLKIEALIEKIAGRVKSCHENELRPVEFSEILEERTILYVVKAFLAILHMINKKIVEAWQDNDSGKILLVPFGTSADFFEKES